MRTRTCIVLLLTLLITGCATADHFPRSPCACDYRLLIQEASHHA